MPLPPSGPLSLTDIQTEFGGTNPIGLSEYYAGGGLVPPGATGTNGPVPSSGQISIFNFFGTQAAVPGIDWTYQDGLSNSQTISVWEAYSTVRSIAWSGTQYVAGGDYAQIATSPDGITWTNRTGLSTTTWGESRTVTQIVWTGSQYVAVGTVGRVATSPDGITWTYQNGLFATAWGASTVLSIVWTGSQYVVVGASGKVATSPDAITWTNRTGLSSTAWGPVWEVRTGVWDGTQYVVGGQSGSVATSP